ncbi:ABC transporter permease [Chitinophaga ginsengisegetis]|uniref:ABC transporter permease n=1 Tax=Chitinophaga ginsengisegetis TaxID=393003 RepID=UPI000DB9F480|nr:ABC transporter permease [Chitinophaga ginsengisegetis]MDR6566436.1 ABC-type antimicrobial peptide transport system permease subunit [Chitinophaga ginsengisegetis]MDR6646166.1 ABC-type antimicrobial peptide transport system permease subunit [Chitinophaga ginsengisegetis]MDR6651242.1 ABC-type antimicrobial peptide transport system permease subunit [Chitinophaga ginsengisegetis]
MLKSYLKIAWRNLRKQKVFAAVNIVGMSTALCAALLLSLTAYREWTYDNFHENGKDIYQLIGIEDTGGQVKTGSSMSKPLAVALQKEVPGVKGITFIAGYNVPVRYGANHYYLGAQMVDKDFLKMFTFPVIKGDKNSALQQLNQVVLTKRASGILFKDTDGVGKTVELNLNGKWQPFIVSAIAADIPDNSGMYFELLTRFENEPEYNTTKSDWSASNFPLFVQLEPGVSKTSFEKNMNVVVNKYYKGKIEDLQKNAGGVKNVFYLKGLPLKDFHLDADSSFYSGLNKFYPWLMIILATLIIGIAAINFINLSIARSFARSGEIGLRKSLGAQNGQLLLQFWAEAFLLCCFALVLSLGLMILLLPYYNQVFGHHIALSVFRNIWVVTGTVAGFFLITLLAGGYPAWKVARLNILQVLKGKLGMGKSSGVRNGLIVVQFMVAVVLISCTSIIWQQLNFIQSAPLGYNSSQVISIPLDNATPSDITTMKNRLAEMGEVRSVSGSMLNLGMGKDGSSGNWTRGFMYKDRHVSTQCLAVDYDYARTLDLKILSGRDFSREYGTDSSAVVINELMAKQLGVTDPVGITFRMSDDEPPVHVIGMVKDYHFESLHKKIDPLVMIMNAPLNYIFVKVETPNPVASLKKITTLWKGINELAESDPSFLDENAQRLYRQEQRFSKIFMSGAVLAVIISCMGLFAIAVLVMAHRKKEIGIRKVLGASVSGIVLLLSKDFLRLVLVAVLIATPAAWYFMHRWLEGFEYHTTIHWWVFGVAGLLAVCIAFLTVSLQSVKAALANPVNSLTRD